MIGYKVEPVTCDHKTRRGFPVMQLTDEGLRCDICEGLYTWERIVELLKYESVAKLLEYETTKVSHDQI